MDATMPASLGDRLWSLLAPLGCLLCGKRVGAGVIFCPKCAALAKGPVTRKLRLPGGERLPVASPMHYTGGYRKTVIDYKFHGLSAYAKPIGWLMAGATAALPEPFDMVVYVPLTRRARLARGYDQSRLLAEAVGRALGLPVVPALVKVRKTRTQHELSAEERAENVRGAYGVKGKVPLEGKALLLVDDIVTTGNTLLDCARALYEAGAVKVCGLCAADAKGPESRKKGGDRPWIRKKSSGPSGTSWRRWERTRNGRDWRRPPTG